MSDELLPYYRSELAFIRRLGAEFAEDHPKMAERLRLGAEGSADPHVERLIEAFAFLTARVRRKLDDDFPEVTHALLDTLYPHYLRPVPSMAIVQVNLDRGQADLVTGYDVPRGSLVETEPTSGGPCRFRTCYDVTAYPLDVGEATLRPLPLNTPGAPKNAAALLRVGLRCWGKEAGLGAFRLPALRFYLRGLDQHVLLLYEYLLNGTLEVAVASGLADKDPVFLGRECVRPVGFDDDQAVLPQPARTFPGYRLLTEYFAFPRKFLFFDVAGLRPDLLARAGRAPELRFYLSASSPELEQNVTADTFRLGCTPVVNLFEMRAEPIHVTHTDAEHRVVPDSRRPGAYEVYSVDRVVSTADGQATELLPFYATLHGASPAHPRGPHGRAFYHASRRASTRAFDEVDHGTEVYLTLADPDFSPHRATDQVLSVQVTCNNRDLPSKLPSGGGRPEMHLVDGGPVALACLTHPTPTLRPSLGEKTLWRLISHLSLNHLSLLDGAGASGDGHAHDGPEVSAAALREVLSVYDYLDQPETAARIAGISRVSHRRTVARAGGVAAGGFCRGLEVTVHFDEERYPDHGLFLFASVLERFLALYCSINSFTQLVATSGQRAGEIRRWAPRAGDRILL